MKALCMLLLIATTVFTSCDEEFGSPCPGCAPGAPKSKVLLNVGFSIPDGLYEASLVDQVVDQAEIQLLDASTREVVARKTVLVKGNGQVIDHESAHTNTAFLFSSQVEMAAPWSLYLITGHAHSQTGIAREAPIDCRNGNGSVQFDY